MSFGNGFKNIFKICVGNGFGNDLDTDLHLQVRIQDLVKGGAQVLRPKVADVVKWCCLSEVSNLQPGSRACLRGPGSFWVFNAQMCILPHSRDSSSLIFDIYFNTKS